VDKVAIFSLVGVGVLLILAEVFVPGGIVGGIGILMLITGIAAGFFFGSPLLGFSLLIGSLVFGLIAFWAWMKLLPRSPMGKRLILQSDGALWDGFDSHQSELAGKEGVAKSPLHPSGIAIIDGRRIDVVTRGEMVDIGAKIKVIEVHGNRVVVAQIASEEN
jgi:membrane-bound serine protease (ClpP class)